MPKVPPVAKPSYLAAGNGARPRPLSADKGPRPYSCATAVNEIVDIKATMSTCFIIPLTPFRFLTRSTFSLDFPGSRITCGPLYTFRDKRTSPSFMDAKARSGWAGVTAWAPRAALARSSSMATDGKEHTCRLDVVCRVIDASRETEGRARLPERSAVFSAQIGKTWPTRSTVGPTTFTRNTGASPIAACIL